jgi:hypothetical protein
VLGGVAAVIGVYLTFAQARGLPPWNSAPSPASSSSSAPTSNSSPVSSTVPSKNSQPSSTTTMPTPVPPTSTPPPQTEYYLADHDPVQTYGINVDTTPRKVNGVMYYHPVAWAASVRADDPYWAEWDVSRGCDWFESPAVGIGDKAPSGAQYLFSVLKDGSDTWDQPVSIGEGYPVKISIQGALRLRLSVAGLKLGGYGPQATWGDPKLSCSSEPPNRKNS